MNAMRHLSESLTYQLLITVTCWYVSTPTLPNVVRRSTGEFSQVDTRLRYVSLTIVPHLSTFSHCWT